MKTHSILPNVARKGTLVVLIAALASSVSCTTTYDAYGRPVQSVDPATATAGIAAAGLIGYAAGKDNDDHHHHHRGGYYDRHGRWHRY